MKKQFDNLLAWKEKIRDSNKANLLKFDQLRTQLGLLKQENEKYKQCLQDPHMKVWPYILLQLSTICTNTLYLTAVRYRVFVQIVDNCSKI